VAEVGDARNPKKVKILANNATIPMRGFIK
jgi:hypothetical protein